MTPAAAINAILEGLASDAGLVVVILLILILGARKTWVWGYQLDAKDSQLKDEQVRHMGEMSAMREERDYWRQMALYFQGQRGPDRPPPPNPLEGS